MGDEKKKLLDYSVPKLYSLNEMDSHLSQLAMAGCTPCQTGAAFPMTCTSGQCADSCTSGASVVYCAAGLGAKGSGCHNGVSAGGHAWCTTGADQASSCVSGSSAT